MPARTEFHLRFFDTTSGTMLILRGLAYFSDSDSFSALYFRRWSL
jgi:hypothetical protein